VQDGVAAPQVMVLPDVGSDSSHGLPVEPSGLQVLTDWDNPLTIRASPYGTSSSGYRLGFARWLTRRESRPAALLARVQVNRIWQHYFSRGLSTTPANLGYSGSNPSHPELLEWLTSDFVESGWSVKSLHRLILTSAVYQQSSQLDADGYRLDPENQLLWRMPLRRLPAESIRDSMLAVSGDLDRRMSGPAIEVLRAEDGEILVYDTARGSKRRSMYLQKRRTLVPTILSVFDTPSIVTNCVERGVSTIPLQSLALLNSEFILMRAASFAKRLANEVGSDSDARIIRAFQLAYGREPDADELRGSLMFLQNQKKQYLGKSPAPLQNAWTDFTHTLLASNEFLYIE